MGLSLPDLTQFFPAEAGWDALPFSFVHINKCGGTSVCEALGLPTLHYTALTRREVIGAARWQQLPSFSIVRNPYSRLTSLYRYRVARSHPATMGGELELNEWVRRAIGQRDPLVFDNPYLFAPCTAWLLDKQGRIMVDLVIKLEQLEEEWPRVEELIGFRVPLGHSNATSRTAGNTETALDAESVAIIQQRFKADFVLLGYDPEIIPGADPDA
ncbi:sulfotransferase family protein [Leisingera thetidis]|uniref:sulfotransferase family protein n=1 Tax=Leisingera thetidis TaxID=2930199 RepID=UPI0021F6EA9C|nr:sulfotransferase family protein [Leisingera thetidis]